MRQNDKMGVNFRKSGESPGYLFWFRLLSGNRTILLADDTDPAGLSEKER